MGGFVCCSHDMRTWLLNKGRSFVYSTALPVPTVAASLQALSTARENPHLRTALWENIRTIAAAVGAGGDSPIIPLVIGEEAAALEISGRLLRQGFHIPAIRPPTVPTGTARLRIAVSAAHSSEDVKSLCNALQHLTTQS
mmetsp:Transcript_38988/g.76217  ORF Transcript_38988/g.76217 Transcript_38988/m.76217 type:complete len:140 (+) Transcript_38988:2-421(+)